MSSSPSSARFWLTVTAGPATELFVVDSQLNLVTRGIGRIEAQLPPDIYKVRSRTGRTETEEILVLNQDRQVNLPWQPEFSSPVPLASTSTAQADQAQAATAISQDVRVHAGLGASVCLIARWWVGDAAPSSRQSPASGISLHTWDGTQVVDLETQGVVHGSGADAVVGCTAQVNPGSYVLRRPSPTGSTIEQTVVASHEWQTQVFLLKRPPARASDGPPDAAALDDVAILLARNGFQPDAEDMHLAELARIALADERRILSGFLKDMAAGKFENPMLGIYAGHILDLTLRRDSQDAKAARKAARSKTPAPVLLKNELQAEDLNVIVSNLRRLLGPQHPDVEALSLQCPAPHLRTKQSLHIAPMLRRSWSLYVEASNRNPRLVPIDLWDRVATTTTAVPFLAWQVRDASTSGDPARAIAAALVGSSSAAVAEAVAARPIPVGAGAGPRRRLRMSSALLPMGVGPMEALEADADDEALRSSAPGRVSKHRLTPTAKRSISVNHDIPRAALNRALRDL